jgi:hypothetical protein
VEEAALRGEWFAIELLGSSSESKFMDIVRERFAFGADAPLLPPPDASRFFFGALSFSCDTKKTLHSQHATSQLKLQ